MYFKVSHLESGYGSVCGVHEFTAPPGVVHVPYHIMEECGLGEGQTVKIDLITPIKGFNLIFFPRPRMTGNGIIEKWHLEQ